MRRWPTRTLVEMALTIALSAVLALINARAPINIAGGTISLNMLPLMVLGVRRGLGPAVVAGIVYGLIDSRIDPFIVHPAQFVLDYPLAYGLVGLAGLGHGAWARRAGSGVGPRDVLAIMPALLLAAVARYAAHVVSGVIFFSANAIAEGQTPLVYSLAYNVTYVVPSAVASIVAAVTVLPALERAVPSAATGTGRGR